MASSISNDADLSFRKGGLWHQVISTAASAAFTFLDLKAAGAARLREQMMVARLRLLTEALYTGSCSAVVENDGPPEPSTRSIKSAIAYHRQRIKNDLQPPKSRVRPNTE